jgi:WD40 repeat protein
MRRQLWLIITLLFTVGGMHHAVAQEDIPSLLMYSVEIGDINLGSQAYSYDLYVMNPTTGEFVFEAETPNRDCPRGFSPDRQWMLYAENSLENDYNDPITYAVELQTGETIELGKIYSARWSSDSRRMIYTQFYDSGQDVYIFDAQSHDIEHVDFVMTFSHLGFEWMGDDWVYAQAVENRIFIEGAGFDSQAFDSEIVSHHFSPDAQWLAVVTHAPEDRQLFIIDTHTGEMPQIVDNVIGGAVPVWSIDGRWLAYSTATGLYLWDVEQQTSQQLVRISEGAEITISNFTWSPDSRYLAYREYIPGGTESTQFAIHILDIETSETQIVRRRINILAGELTWASNTQLAYTHANSETAPDERIHDIYLYDVTTDESINLTNSPETERFVCLAD